MRPYLTILLLVTASLSAQAAHGCDTQAEKSTAQLTRMLLVQRGMVEGEFSLAQLANGGLLPLIPIQGAAPGYSLPSQVKHCGCAGNSEAGNPVSLPVPDLGVFARLAPARAP